MTAPTLKPLRTFRRLMPLICFQALSMGHVAAAPSTGVNDRVMSGGLPGTGTPPQAAENVHPSPVQGPTRTVFDPELVREIQVIHGSLELQTGRINDQLGRFKQAGYLDRRIKRDLEGGLREARATLFQVLGALQSGGLEPWQTRELAQDLNYQGDRLDAALFQWRENMGAAGEGKARGNDAANGSRQEQQRLMQTLSEISRKLHDTGREMVRQSQ